MFIIKLLIILILSLVLSFYLPWYTPFIICFLTGLIFSNKPGNNFLAGLLSVGIFWLCYALFLDLKNEHVLSTKIATLFSTSLNTQITSGVLIMATTFIGAILGGLSAMSGAMIVDNGSRKRRKAVKNGSYKLKL